MVLLPIVERELRVAARKAITHRLRWVFGFTLAMLLAWQLFLLTGSQIPAAVQGRKVFSTLVVICFIYAMFVGARAADALSSERREGTLGLLFLTDLSSLDVVLGKLAANSLNATYGLIAAIPFLAFPLLMGGVTGAEFLRAGVVLLNTLLLSLSVGILVSSLSQNERRALFATAVILICIAIGPFALLYYVLDKFHASFFGASEMEVAGVILGLGPALGIVDLVAPLGPTRIPSQLIWGNQLFLLLASLALIRASNVMLARRWSDRPASALIARIRLWWHELLHGTGAARKLLRQRLLDLNPFTWLVSRERLKPAYAWGFVICLALVWLWSWWRHSDVVFDWYPAAPTFLIMHAFAKLWVASEASHRLVEDQREGAMELLLSTPMTPERIIAGQWAAFRRQFVRPFLLLCVLEWIAFFNKLEWWAILGVQLVFWADLAALVYIGLWNGLISRNLTQALLRAAGLILFLPWAIFLLFVGPGGVFPRWMGFERSGNSFAARMLIWTLLSLLISFACGYWARRKLNTHFRAAVLARFSRAKREEE
ncbi:MAG TPA: ABC transporter permease subunit [Methylomirabilota bacterium]|nr:ABC transporter permease subunit [Methylomirabilota bacterium]